MSASRSRRPSGSSELTGSSRISDRLGDEGMGDPEPLAHPARIAGDPSPRRIGQADALERLGRPGPARRPPPGRAAGRRARPARARSSSRSSAGPARGSRAARGRRAVRRRPAGRRSTRARRSAGRGRSGAGGSWSCPRRWARGARRPTRPARRDQAVDGEHHPTRPPNRLVRPAGDVDGWPRRSPPPASRRSLAPARRRGRGSGPSRLTNTMMSPRTACCRRGPGGPRRRSREREDQQAELDDDERGRSRRIGGLARHGRLATMRCVDRAGCMRPVRSARGPLLDSAPTSPLATTGTDHLEAPE